ncbi:aldo/keto reductase [Pelagicoccus mobilis]|uniref:Aldo/keto reductase n=1 Tax=Pelagicoccus mobilis TaxID=415221 RepID=A0A934RZ68_9BACT|nr:aldo/keto reductase [Pelagicoccus mobilis]MBK1879028.1 aldo/keto reductase [Pelagicoccus mobilis]
MTDSRRAFIKKSAKLAALAPMLSWAAASQESDSLGNVLPMRKLTRDGERVTSLCLGGYHLGFTENAKEAEAMVERSMELGIRFFDNARKYHGGRSEEYMGRFLTPKYREKIFLMSKAPDRTAEGVRRQLDETLKALKTDYLDLWQIHALQTPKDVDNRMRDGVLEVFLEAKAQGKVRYIGFTGHRNPKTHLHFLEFLDKRGLLLDTCQMPLNVCDPSFESFEKHVLPVLLEKEYGVIAMKTMAGGSMMGGRIDTTPQDIRTKDIPDVVAKTDLTLANLHQYVYSLPISSLCTGCRKLHEIEENVAVLQNLKDLSETDKERLIEIAKPYAGLIVENYKRVFA